MGEDMGLMYLKGVVGPKALYNMELIGVEYTPTRVRQLWESVGQAAEQGNSSCG